MSDLGHWGERLAAQYLQSRGYTIISRNWHAAEGEIDVIVERSGELVFVEVKTRRSRAYGPPEEAVHARKQARLRRTAWRYLEAHDLLDKAWRIDVIAIVQAADGAVARFDHYENAVEAVRDPRRK
jgi:putative endonuclease